MKEEYVMELVKIEIKELNEDEINVELFANFTRRQVVQDCWRKVDGAWVIKPDPFVDDWSGEDYVYLVRCLKHTVRSGGVVFGAFYGGLLKGFASVEAERFGSRKQYMDLSCIHVSAETRGTGMGRRLFALAAEWAGEQGAEKLYISAHSAVESQAFYRALGCVEAEEYDLPHVEREPYDCQMEYCL